MKYLYALLLILLPTLSYADFDTKEVQQFQREFDAEHFQINEGFEKSRHVSASPHEIYRENGLLL